MENISNINEIELVRPSRFVHPIDFRTYTYGVIIFVLLLLDFVPRFYQGDSISYLTTEYNGWMPPERSWSFGIIINFLLRNSGSYTTLILIQAAMLGCVVLAMRLFFRGLVSWQIAYSVTALVVCFDPLIEIYTRFFMSDFLSFVCFMFFLLGIYMVISPDTKAQEMRIGFFLALATAVAAVFIRVAYALIMELTVLIICLLWFVRLNSYQWKVLGALAGIPLVAVGLLVSANSVVFAHRFPNEMFAVKLSGVSLAAIFAPALEKSDFEHAGIEITDEEFQRLDLGNYDKRLYQAWAESPDNLNRFLRAKLMVDVDDEYPAIVDRTASHLVYNAFWRNPLSFFMVYVTNAGKYLMPSEWRKHFDEEMGSSRTLPEDFVTWFNSLSSAKIVAETPLVRSWIISAYEALTPIYPLQLAFGLCACVFLLLRQYTRPCVVILSAALLADLAAAPVYSMYVIPRFILAAIFINYFLIGLVCLHWCRRGGFDKARSP